MRTVQPFKNIEDIERMKAALKPRDRLLFILGINTNLRISDLLLLKREDVQGDRIVITEAKTGKRKTIRLGDRTIEQVAPLLPSEGYLFPSRKGNAPISRVQAWRILKAASARLGLDIEVGTHSMRKSFAYHAYKQGTDITLLMRVLNHSSPKETLRYIGIESEDIDNVYINTQL